MKSSFFFSLISIFTAVLSCSQNTRSERKKDTYVNDASAVVEIRNPGTKGGNSSHNPPGGGSNLQLVDLHFDKGTSLNFSKIRVSVESLIVRFTNSKEVRLDYDTPKVLYVRSAGKDSSGENNILSFEISAELASIPIESVKLVLSQGGKAEIFGYDSDLYQTKIISDGIFEGRTEKSNTTFSNSKDYKLTVSLPDTYQESSSTKLEAKMEEGKPVELWKNSTVECQDQSKMEIKDCKYFDEISNIFSQFCEGKASSNTGKVGFMNFSVGEECTLPIKLHL
jgi:hypothetical protein